MANNVIGLFDSEGVAERVIDDLVGSGFDRDSITRFRGDHDDLEGELEREGVPTAEASYYVNGLQEGGALVSVRAEEADTNRAVEIMNRYANAGDEASGDRTAHDAASEPATGLAADRYESNGLAATPGVEDHATNRTTDGTTEDAARLEVVEEQLRVGKREVERGGVRVRRVVSETPVTEQVTLRDETVHVERRAVDRPLKGNADDLFTERTFEFTETDEEAVVAKEARIVEEVVVDKEVVEHTQTVQDTVRRTDVEVEEFAADAGRASYGASDPDYVYGQVLASDARYAGRNWDDLEADARRDWEAQNRGGSWDDVKDRVRDAWGRSRR